MKKTTYIYIILAALIMQSCKKELLDINTNPNSPSGVDPNLVLAPTLANAATRLNNPGGANANYFFSALWMGYSSFSGNFAIGTPALSYKFTTAFEGGIWASTYQNIANLNYVDSIGVKKGNTFIAGIAKIIRSMEYQNLVDVFNNIPYKEGGKAADGPAYYKPKYDDAKTIYEDLIKQIDEGVALIKKSISNPSGTVDVMFGGNKTLWAKFANTLKLRILLRQSELTGRTAYIQAEIAKITSEGSGYLGAGESALVNPGFTNSTNKMNPWWASNYDIDGQYANNFFVANQYAINFYKDNNDPRLRYFYSPVKGYKKGSNGADSIFRNDGVDYKFAGNFFGDQGLANSDISFMGRGTLKSPTQSAVLLSSFESLFLQAEAAQRGWISGSSKTLFEKAVEESFVYLGARRAPIRNVSNTADSVSYTPAESALMYTSQPGNKEVNFAACVSDAEKLSIIIRQKWAALNNISVLEAWNDYRRLHLPADIPLSKSPFAASSIPVRLLYPQSEYNYNPDNVQAQGNIDQFTSKIFWIK